MAISPKSPARRPRSASQRHPRFPRLLAIILAAGLTLGAGFYALAAIHATSAFEQRLTSSSFAFTGRLQFTGQDFLSPMDTDMSFSGHFSQTSPPALDAQFLGNWAGKDYSGLARATAGRLYFNLSGPVMPVIRYRQGSYFLPLTSGAWYSAKVDESLYDNVCAHTQPATLQSKLELYRTIRSLKLSPSPWVNFWSRLDGQPATHLSATVTGAQLAGLWDAAQKATPPECGDPNTLGISSADLRQVQTKLDLFTGNTTDKLVISLSDKTLGASATLTLDTSDYGSQPAVTIPAGVTDINALYAGQGLR